MPPEERGGRRAARFRVGQVIAAAAVAAVLIAAAALAVAAFAPVGAAKEPGPAAGRAVASLRSDVLVERDGDVRVTERITYEFGGDGSPVVRRLPHTASIDGAPERDLGLRGVDVSDDGGVRPVETAEEGGRTEVRIGDPGDPLTGTRSFTIEYVYEDLLVQDSRGRPRLFFDAVGTDWSLPVRRATVDVSLPGAPEEAACYAGPQGSRSPCDSAEQGGDGAVFTQRSIAPGQAVSVDLSLAPGDLDAEIPGPREEGGGTDSTMAVLLAFAWGVAVLTVLGIVFGAGRTVAGGGGPYGGSHGGGGGDGGDGGAGDGGGGGGGD
ncbi:DUF2207 domain-containing protein [Nocardiopsis sp. CNT-189]|uniref:DUF2207 domain-containing protein n=1 Tax=Nocardiopsis oceanisediminis TaxID=2816862 RepID=UPI003B37730E